MKSNEDRLSQLSDVQQECKELFRKKNTDYADSFSLSGVVGILVRLGDKLDRMKNISKKSIVLVDDEKMRDTLLDICNYSAMAVMLLDEQGEEKGKHFELPPLPDLIVGKK